MIFPRYHQLDVVQKLIVDVRINGAGKNYLIQHSAASGDLSGFDHKLGAIETIGEDKNSKHLKNAINDGVRIIVTTLQKFPVIYTEVDKANGRCFAVIVDEAHSSQTGSSALKLKTALADTEEALREYA